MSNNAQRPVNLLYFIPIIFKNHLQYEGWRSLVLKCFRTQVKKHYLTGVHMQFLLQKACKVNRFVAFYSCKFQKSLKI